MPVLAPTASTVAAGMLGYHAVQPEEIYEISARQVDRILRGTWAGEISVEQPTRIDLVLSRSTFESLG